MPFILVLVKTRISLNELNGNQIQCRGRGQPSPHKSHDQSCNHINDLIILRFIFRMVVTKTKAGWS